MGIQTALDSIRDSERLIDALRLSDDLAFEASRNGGVRTLRVLAQTLNGDDQLAAIASVHALGQIFDDEAVNLLGSLLSSERAFIREHAAWVIGFRLPKFDAVGRLIAMVIDGGFSGMLAQRTLEQWSATASNLIGVGLEGALLGVHEPEPRARLIETISLVRRGLARRVLLRTALDRGEHEIVRVAAISALGQRPGHAGVSDALAVLAKGDDHLAHVAQLALLDISSTWNPSTDRAGLTVAQLFLNADIDAGLDQAGKGDNGGIATLLVRLGDALLAGPGSIDRVVTLSRGSVDEALQSAAALPSLTHGHGFGRIPLFSEPVSAAAAWPLRVTARRGIRRMLKAAGSVDVIHLRMADVGSLAAVDVARELGIPVVFTVAPDPHAVINSLGVAGRLTRENFGDVDEHEHFWFRSRLVQRLAANASQTVLFPRPELQRDMLELVGIDITQHPERHSIVAEGIDLGVVDAAVEEASTAASGRATTAPLQALAELLDGLPAERRDLPLIVSVGRLHRVKGMATIVESWKASGLAERANLLIVGGDLVAPSPDEQEQLDLIDAIVPRDERATHGLLLPGHQPNDTVARWVAAARFGLPGYAAPRGIYVCGSLKEEFGIALLEAMATGLLVVAPDGGGPATYVERDVTGILTQTWDAEQLGAAMVTALDLAAAEQTSDRAERSRAVVEESFTIQAMARELSNVYDHVAAAERDHRRESEGFEVTVR
ncbi:glycosyltransferase involved in cell wall biosynthesis [Microbacteriaceae bacterium SG_E_30_P1]|uniref:D-inositol 3-phosphate glycosyltransferase n=1 Tax=Antiquaquibacter oligotrophicus TaxID=2880260 RepID=A0ABT6KKF8_9MICO|nr:glycosyltransferase [Antiquaquibacter oligotrophicus]MDH6180206.1 glycosyltransferase involved in cell wall biosynthesis [Antiquaquibacter oligotrophicus]UDF14047.1 glycosyltransferase [Antiquaquibacter oligotrophicus]